MNVPRWLSATWLVATSLLGGAGVACGDRTPEQLPPLGEVVVSIDTDAPVPQLVGRLRVDLFDDHGNWLESRDIARTEAADWPASFSLYTEDGVTPRRVLVRARGYLEGRVRSYRGERFAERPSFVEPAVASTLAGLCDDPPELELGRSLTLRRGTRFLTGTIPEPPPADAASDWTPQCGVPTAGGAVAARLEIAEPGDYRIEATRVRPSPALGGDTILFLRKDCRDPDTQLACFDDSVPYEGLERFLEADLLPRIVMHLEPGSYAVLAGGFSATPSEVTLRATLLSKWNEEESLEPEPLPVLEGLPRLSIEGRDVTPRDEPAPLTAIDRLALLTLMPGEKRLAQLTLRVACAGQMAKLSQEGSNAVPVLTEAETCIDEEGVRVALTEEEAERFSHAPQHSLVDTVEHGEACPGAVRQDTAICMPAGAFVLGSNEGNYWLRESTVPERFAMMNRFWLDRAEVTVARWRTALNEGFESPSKSPLENNAALATGSGDSALRHCTYSATPASAVVPREDLPLTCIDWYAARAFCRFRGGDLPTEAQWQYAATKAGRAFETRFPWGDQPPRCNQAVLQRTDTANYAGCRSAGYGPVPVTDPAVLSDATPLDVRDLAGNVSEWALDSFSAFDSACWSAASLVDPVCWEENAPERPMLGGDWLGVSNNATGWTRARAAPSGVITWPDDVERPIGGGAVSSGFRCAYPEEPE